MSKSVNLPCGVPLSLGKLLCDVFMLLWMSFVKSERITEVTRLEYSQFGLGEYKFRTESLCYKLEVLSLKDVGVGCLVYRLKVRIS